MSTNEFFLTEFRVKNENGHVFHFDNDQITYDHHGEITKWELFSDYLNAFIEIPVLQIERNFSSKFADARDEAKRRAIQDLEERRNEIEENKEAI